MSKENLGVAYDFAHRHNRFEINVSEGAAIPLLVLALPERGSSGNVVKKGVLYLGDYIVDDFIATHPNIKDEWFLVSTTQSHVIPTSIHPDLHLYTTQDGMPSPTYRASLAGQIPDLILGCGHYVDPSIFYPEPGITKDFDLFYVSKWAPTKRVEHLLDAAQHDPSLHIGILGSPVVSERKRAASDQYREFILRRIQEQHIMNVTVLEHPEEKHVNSDGTEVVGGFSKDEIRQYLNRSHSVVLTADANEAINRSLVEALCCDVPIMLTTDTQGGAQTLINPETGVFIPPSGVGIVEGIQHIKQTRDKMNPRGWYTSTYGRHNANRILWEKILSVSNSQDATPVSTQSVKEYTGDIWGYDYYNHNVGK